jgi:type I restriction enzyme S subunit
MEKAYETYIHTGVEWIERIPESWILTKLKFLLGEDAFRSGPFGSSLITSKLNDYGNVLVYTPEHIAGKNVTNELYLPEEREEEMSKYLIAERDIVLPIVGTLGNAKLFTESDEKGILNQRLCRISPNENKIEGEYLLLLLKYAQFIKEQLNLEKKGAILDHITKNVIFNFDIPLPSIKEQTQIEAYLDYHTQLIDTLISKKETLIQKLQEQRQAIINEAVTKGLNKNVALKDSGIEYVGNIAENWSNKRVKHSCYVKGRIGWKGLKSDDYLDKGYAYLVTGTDFTGQVVDWSKCHFVNQERYEEDPFIQLEEGDLLITKDGTIGKTTLVKNLNKPACLNSGIFLVRSLIPDLNINFFYWVLNSNVFKQFIDLTSTGATIKHLYQNVFIEFTYALPPLEEQIEIQKYLFQKFDEFEVSINKVKSSIQKLKDYRRSLISEAVTGKIDVRDWQHPENKS